MRLPLAPLLVLSLTLIATAARADEGDPDRHDKPSASTSRVGLGGELGSWGGALGVGARARIPVVGFVFVAPRVVMLTSSGPGSDRLDAGTRLDLILQSPKMANAFRVYGGGGPQWFVQVGGDGRGPGRFGGGGQFGVELLASSAATFFFEVGAQSGARGDFAEGATVIAGVHAYPF